MQTVPNTERNWWKESVIYQIYPRSFKDTNNDGIGDLNGVTQKLDYLQQLGINIIWLCPIYKSPNADNGYDISDYYAIMDEFGTMQDFDNLLAAAKTRNIKIIIDLVVNHCSDEHEWFKQAKSDKNSPYRNFFYWKAPVNGQPPNDWNSFWGPSAWEWDHKSEEYYLHFFAKKQPDLNWENPILRQEVYKMMRFWLDKGVAGFRMDVISLISKDLSFPNFPTNFNGDFPSVFANGPRVHEFLQEMNREVLSKYDIMTVGEAIGVTAEQANLYVGKSRNELNMIVHFDYMFLDCYPHNMFETRKWVLPEFKAIMQDWDTKLGQEGWNSIHLGNHDFPRIVSRFGNDSEMYRVISAKMLATFLLTLRGTPYIYQGDEIGMTNVAFPSIHDYNDIAIKNAYKAAVKSGKNLAQFLKGVQKHGRDNARTPIQWSNQNNAGFTTATPWLKINPNYTTINVEAALNNPNSIFYYYQQLIQLRKNNLVLVYGTYTDIAPKHEQIFAYTRTWNTQKWLIVLNFSKQNTTFELPKYLHQYKIVIKFGNYVTSKISSSTVISMHAYEAIIAVLE